MSIARTTVTGALAGTPESKHVGESLVLSCSIPARRGWGDKEVTDWYRIEVWGKRAESLLKLVQGGHLTKGTIVTATGILKPRVYTNKQGQPAIALDLDAREFEPVFGHRANASQHGMAIPDDGEVSF